MSSLLKSTSTPKRFIEFVHVTTNANTPLILAQVFILFSIIRRPTPGYRNTYRIGVGCLCRLSVCQSVRPMVISRKRSKTEEISPRVTIDHVEQTSTTSLYTLAVTRDVGRSHDAAVTPSFVTSGDLMTLPWRSRCTCHDVEASLRHLIRCRYSILDFIRVTSVVSVHDATLWHDVEVHRTDFDVTCGSWTSRRGTSQ